MIIFFSICIFHSLRKEANVTMKKITAFFITHKRWENTGGLLGKLYMFDGWPFYILQIQIAMSIVSYQSRQFKLWINRVFFPYGLIFFNKSPFLSLYIGKKKQLEKKNSKSHNICIFFKTFDPMKIFRRHLFSEENSHEWK